MSEGSPAGKSTALRWVPMFVGLTVLSRASTEPAPRTDPDLPPPDAKPPDAGRQTLAEVPPLRFSALSRDIPPPMALPHAPDFARVPDAIAVSEALAPLPRAVPSATAEAPGAEALVAVAVLPSPHEPEPGGSAPMPELAAPTASEALTAGSPALADPEEQLAELAPPAAVGPEPLAPPPAAGLAEAALPPTALAAFEPQADTPGAATPEPALLAVAAPETPREAAAEALVQASPAPLAEAAPVPFAGLEEVALPAPFPVAAPAAPVLASLAKTPATVADTALTPAPATATTILPPTGAEPASASLAAPDFGQAQGTRSFPPELPERTAKAPSPAPTESPVLSYDDEMILEVRVAGVPGDDTVVAYGAQGSIYLPLGELARFLDLAIVVSDDGNYAAGWFLDEKRTLTVDLRNHRAQSEGRTVALGKGDAVAFDGELYLRAEVFAQILPLSIKPDLRNQAITIATDQPFPFEQRVKREAERKRLALQGQDKGATRFVRQETPWRALDVPLAGLELRGISDSALGERTEADLRLSGDLAWMSAQLFLSGSTLDGITSAHGVIGRSDPDADLLGPLAATGFGIGDVSTDSMAVGLRGVAGRGAFISNRPLEAASVFERIDLRGPLPEGYEVELYRNGILVGSTRETIDGQYAFLQVPVDYGVNLFRLVFYGPQGQRSEEVRRLSVGDGRLPQGKLVYNFGAVQRDVNVLGVTAPRTIAPDWRGDWRVTGELAYGLTSDLTMLAGAAWFQSEGRDRMMASTGLRTGIGPFAAKLDVAVQDGGASTIEAGLAGRVLGGSVTLTHAEFRGDFQDELYVSATDRLRRVTDFTANASLRISATRAIPMTLRARRLEFAGGREDLQASLRASTRIGRVMASNTFDFTRTSGTGLGTTTRLAGSFDLASFAGSRTQVRGNLSYEVVPSARISGVGASIDHAIDARTLASVSADRAFETRETTVSASAVRRFAHFTLALEGRYNIRTHAHSLALRLGLALGRNPLTSRGFVTGPGDALAGGAALLAFQDMDGDGHYTPGDRVLPEVAFGAGQVSGETGKDGTLLLTGLPTSSRASIQVDPSSLPDIAMAPLERGFEIVPRPGRIHVAEVPIVALSDIEGIARFDQGGSARAVSGVRLELVDAKGAVAATARTESDGFYLFERISPGRYSLRVEPEQAGRLGIAVAATEDLAIPPESQQLIRDLVIARR